MNNQNKLLFVLVSIPLLMLAPSIHVNAAVSPEQHKCLHDKISGALTHAGIIAAGDLSGGGGFDAGMKMENEILAIVDNSTANVESCLK